MANTNGSKSLTKSMNGLIDILDGAGTEIVDGTITCKSITTSILNAVNLIITNLTATLANITTLYVSTIRSNSLNPVVMDDTTYNSVSFADKCDCDINIGGSQYGTRINIGNKIDRISDINIGNGSSASGNVNIENGANSTGQVAIKQFIFTSNNIRNTVFTSPLSLFTTQTGNITLGNGSISTTIATFIFSSNQVVTTLLYGALNLFTTHVNIINIGSLLSSIRQKGDIALGLSGNYANAGTCGIDVATGTNLTGFNFHSGPNWSTWDTDIRSSGGNGTNGGGSLYMDASTFVLSNNSIYSFDVLPSSSSVNLNFHSGTTNTTYDSQISAIGGTGVIGKGTLSLTSGKIQINQALTAGYDPFTITGLYQMGYTIYGTGTTSALFVSVTTNIRQITLAAGVWLLQGNVLYSNPGGYTQLSISSTSATLDSNCANVTAGVPNSITNLTRIVDTSRTSGGFGPWYLCGGCGANNNIYAIGFIATRIA